MPSLFKDAFFFNAERDILLINVVDCGPFSLNVLIHQFDISFGISDPVRKFTLRTGQALKISALPAKLVN